MQWNTPYLWMSSKMVEKTPLNALKDGGENDEISKNQWIWEAIQDLIMGLRAKLRGYKATDDDIASIIV